MNLKELEEKAAGVKARLNQNYHFAKQLGFTSYESVILQSKNKGVIIDLAIQRGLIKDAKDDKAQ